ncbi:MAG: DUF2059 domain-containing protein [Desulfobacterales bacterium]|nr:DUF2059 domain-containing protein [Desulfobacterales bacterium]
MGKKLPKTIVILCLSFLFFLATCPYTQAQEKNAELKVYQKFFKATNIEAQYNQIQSIMIIQLQQGFAASFRETIKNMGDTTPEEKDKLKQLFEQAMGSFVKRMKVKINDVMPLNEVINNVYYPVFSKHYTVAEVKELTAFYESPIGQKFISTTQTVMQESLTIMNEKYAPQVQKNGIKIAEEELKKIKPEIEKMQKNN